MQMVLLLWHHFQVLDLGITLVYPIQGFIVFSKSLMACTTILAMECALPSSLFEISEIYVTTILQRKTSNHIYNLIKQGGYPPTRL